MPEIDKVLEAQKIIDSIAEELKKLGSAAQLLSDSGKGIEAVLGAAKSILESAGAFTTTSGELLKRLATVDIDNRLKNAESKIDELSLLAQRMAQAILGELDSGFGKNEQTVGSLKESVNALSNGIADLHQVLGDLKAEIGRSDATQSERMKSLEAATRGLTKEVGVSSKTTRWLMIGAFGLTWLLVIVCLVKMFL